MDLKQLILDNQLEQWLAEGIFGLEKEGLRAKPSAYLAETPHPEALGDRETNPYIKTDYGESQPELATPPLAPYWKSYNWLQALHAFLVQSLPADEYMWPFSVPCRLPADETAIKIAATTDSDLIAYRNYTAAKYGKKRQLVSGIHINYSFHPLFMEKLFAAQKKYLTADKLQNALYLKLANHFLRYQWLLVYLFGATPVAADAFFEGPFYEGVERPIEAMRSLRNSIYGFTNNQEVAVRYDSVEHYAKDLQCHVEKGALAKEREYYGAVRLRGFVKDSTSLLHHGIQYLEFRSFDLNPFHALGLTKDTLKFVHLFFLTLLLLNEEVNTDEAEKGNQITKEVAIEPPLSQTKRFEEGLWLLDEMDRVLADLKMDASYHHVLNQALECLNHPEKTLSGQLVSQLNQGKTLFEMGEQLGLEHKHAVLSTEAGRAFDALDSAEQAHLFNLFHLNEKLKGMEEIR